MKSAEIAPLAAQENACFMTLALTAETTGTYLTAGTTGYAGPSSQSRQGCASSGTGFAASACAMTALENAPQAEAGKQQEENAADAVQGLGGNVLQQPAA